MAAVRISERYAYSAYGTPTITDASGTASTTTAIGNRYTYTGREWDETLSLYHYRARMYDSVAGAFCSRDPIGFEGSKWSLYEYVNSSPTNAVDALGTFCWWVKTPMPCDATGTELCEQICADQDMAVDTCECQRHRLYCCWRYMGQDKAASPVCKPKKGWQCKCSRPG